MSKNEGMDIVEFLEARLSGDEREASDMLARCSDPEQSLENGWDVAYAERVAAECAAKRVIVGTYKAVAANRNAEGSIQWHEERALLTSVKAIAAVYADHQDYRAKWAL